MLSQSMTKNPLLLLQSWLNEATESDLQPNPDTMAIATADSEGVPNARMVLCKEINAEKGYVVFYTNYNSVKSIEIKENPKSAPCSIGTNWDTRSGSEVKSCNLQTRKMMPILLPALLEAKLVPGRAIRAIL